ncbi:MAG TPA: hypothetical protein VNW94_05415, partial [Streptosporangiaceae bacterium]|nr:hypothetical protein [Streptosporangiaceae bacterium]
MRANSKAAYRGRMARQGRRVRDRLPAPAVPDGYKYCPRCQEIKRVEDFGRNRANDSGFTNYCLPCHNEVSRENRIKKHGSTRNFHLKRRYGVTEAEVDVLRKRQGGICVICLRAPSAHV